MIHKPKSDELVGCELHDPHHIAPNTVEEHPVWKKDEFFYFCVWACYIIWDLDAISPTFFGMGLVSSDSHECEVIWKL